MNDEEFNKMNNGEPKKKKGIIKKDEEKHQRTKHQEFNKMRSNSKLKKKKTYNKKGYTADKKIEKKDFSVATML